MVDNPSFCFLAFSCVCSSILLFFCLLCALKRISLFQFGSYNNRKSQQSKSLEAEERRRKNLNDSLHSLRSLVPRSTTLDRVSVLRDTIEFVKALQKQVKELQDELEQEQQSGIQQLDDDDDDDTSENYDLILKQKQELDALNDKQTQEKETIVEVEVIEGNGLLVKVLCEHRSGGFVKLMEAFNTLRMEISHASVTTHKGLVSNTFKVQKKENEMVGTEDVRDSLLQLIK